MDGDPEAGILRMLPGSKVRNIEESCLEIWKETVSHPFLNIYALSIIEIAGRLAVRTRVTGNLTSLLSSSLANMRDALSSLQKSYLQSSWKQDENLNWHIWIDLSSSTLYLSQLRAEGPKKIGQSILYASMLSLQLKRLYIYAAILFCPVQSGSFPTRLSPEVHHQVNNVQVQSGW